MRWSRRDAVCARRISAPSASDDGADLSRRAALHGAPPTPSSSRREPVVDWRISNNRSRVRSFATTRALVHIPDVLEDLACATRAPRLVGRRATHLVVPMLKDGGAIGAIVALPPRSPAVHRQANRTGPELRRPGGDRHREHAAAQRAAPAHRRSLRVAGAADRDLGGAAGHLQFARRACSRCSTPCWKTRRASARRRFGTSIAL